MKYYTYDNKESKMIEELGIFVAKFIDEEKRHLTERI
jgi:hypothetical protein